MRKLRYLLLDPHFSSICTHSFIVYSAPFTSVFSSLKAEPWTELRYVHFIWESKSGKDSDWVKHELLMMQWGSRTQSFWEPCGTMGNVS